MCLGTGHYLPTGGWASLGEGGHEKNSTPNGGGVKISFMNLWGWGGAQI